MDLRTKLDQEIEARIKELEDPNYDYGPPLNKQDFIGILILAVVSVVGLIWGLS